MSRWGAIALGMALIAVTCTGCGDDTKSHGEAALKDACEGVLGSGLIKEARASEEFDSLHTADGERSHAAASKSLTKKGHAAYTCLLDDEDSSTSESGALSIKFSPNRGALFPEDQKQSYSAYKAYRLENGMQAISESGSATVYFECRSPYRTSPFPVTGRFQTDLDLSDQAEFQALFSSSRKMVGLLKCENEIKFPDPATMKYLPLKKN
ncbi:hypothetical protein [Streptomyces sp. NBC_01601]|uniref:hypothetical protein n=1 Tax=Streptomyces sp. NBC_01601 TaxID=2975892 RepID=UPI002E2D480F|nr:hypothetical protein [Streptomyces sp. NBC_01601]